MTAICETTFHKHQKRLAKMIEDFEAMRKECCNTDQTDARDKMGMVLSHLYAAQAIGGGLYMNDDGGAAVQPLSGGK